MLSFRSSVLGAMLAASTLTTQQASAQQLPPPTPAFTTPQHLNLRAGPGVQNPVLLSMPRHSQVWVYYCLPQPYWCYISFGQYVGWASATYLVSYPNTPPPQIYPVPQPYPYPAPPQQPGYWTYPGPQDNIQLVPIFGAQSG